MQAGCANATEQGRAWQEIERLRTDAETDGYRRGMDAQIEERLESDVHWLVTVCRWLGLYESQSLELIYREIKRLQAEARGSETERLLEENAALLKQWNDLDQRTEKRHREWNAEVERLQAIVDKLPTTADGVPVVPGMMLYLPGSAYMGRAMFHTYGFTCGNGGPLCGQCYSTKDAASAVKDGEQ